MGRFRLCRFGGEAPQQRPDLDKRRIVELLARVDDLLHERQFETVARLGALSFDRGERRAKGEQDTALQARPAGERGEALALRLKDKGGDARQRQARKLGQSLREQCPFSAKQRTQQQGRRQRAGGAQRARELRPLDETA